MVVAFFKESLLSARNYNLNHAFCFCLIKVSSYHWVFEPGMVLEQVFVSSFLPLFPCLVNIMHKMSIKALLRDKDVTATGS